MLVGTMTDPMLVLIFLTRFFRCVTTFGQQTVKGPLGQLGSIRQLDSAMIKSALADGAKLFSIDLS